MHRLLTVYLLLAAPACLLAQVGPQGQSGRWVLWTSAQVQQQLTDRWTWNTVLGASSRSSFASSNPLRYFGLACVRQEFGYKAPSGLRLSVGALYAVAGNGGLDEEDPYGHELRLYPVVGYQASLGPVSLGVQLRTDFRYRFAPGPAEGSKPFELRNRLGIKLAACLTKDKRLTLVANTELLAATTLRHTEGEPHRHWESWHLKESRNLLVLQTRLAPKWLLDTGAMLQIRIGAEPGEALSAYLVTGITLENPFGKRLNRKKNTVR